MYIRIRAETTYIRIRRLRVKRHGTQEVQLRKPLPGRQFKLLVERGGIGEKG